MNDFFKKNNSFTSKSFTMKKVIFAFVCLFSIAVLRAEPKLITVFNAPLIDSTGLSNYVGVYKLEENGYISTYTVTVEEGKLFGQANGFDKTELNKQPEAHTFQSGYGSTVVFMSEAADKPISKVKLVVQGNTIFGTK